MREPAEIMAAERPLSPVAPTNPPDLVREALAGDRAAAETLWKRQSPRLLRAAIALGVPPDDAPDVVQEALLSGFRALGRFNPARASLDGWLHTILVRRCANWRRARRRWLRALGGLTLIAATPPSPREEILDARRTLEHLLQDLPPMRRAAWVLVEVSGLSDEEVSRALGVKESTVRSHLRHAREAMRRRGEQGP